MFAIVLRGGKAAAGAVLERTPGDIVVACQASRSDAVLVMVGMAVAKWLSVSWVSLGVAGRDSFD